ncbi:MAG: DUF4446 family protein [Lachnospiraceae bacterium]|nr:DUF4446 family protein [Lachnospiraceae bacterium]MBQ8634313.1 DUF4446 family protein [Lachnospiraceae bacterium]
MNGQPLNQEQILLIAVFVMAILTVALLTTTIILLVKIGSLTKKYNAFMKGSDGHTLESTILNRFKEIDILKEESKYTSEKLNIACETLITAYQKIGIVKYDAFKEMGGKLSFSLCLLDDENNGFILTSMHTREGCYTYVKEIIKGESFVVLAAEERRALEEAKNRRSLYAE